ncbi:MAG: hypothetical protein WDN26_12385 [Chitinophagaceae bacterium]
MLTDEEKGFIAYWEKKTVGKKEIDLAACRWFAIRCAAGRRDFYQLFLGLVHTCHHGDQYELFRDTGRFSRLSFNCNIHGRFLRTSRWDMNEQHYKELLAKRDKQ